eukprot:1683836-Pyramimonas_sp.AAC.1
MIPPSSTTDHMHGEGSKSESRLQTTLQTHATTNGFHRCLTHFPRTPASHDQTVSLPLVLNEPMRPHARACRNHQTTVAYPRTLSSNTSRATRPRHR